MHLIKYKNTLIIFKLMIVICIFYNCNSFKKDEEKEESLYSQFQNPSPEARPFVRWWWNGNKINPKELDRQLESLKSVGFGGVEINPIAMSTSFDKQTKSLVWMSNEWIDMVVHASKKAKDLGMITDIIAGTGWPFGGEFLQKKQN